MRVAVEATQNLKPNLIETIHNRFDDIKNKVGLDDVK